MKLEVRNHRLETGVCKLKKLNHLNSCLKCNFITLLDNYTQKSFKNRLFLQKVMSPFLKNDREFVTLQSNKMVPPYISHILKNIFRR